MEQQQQQQQLMMNGTYGRAAGVPVPGGDPEDEAASSADGSAESRSSPAWLQHVLRSLADAQRDLAGKVGNSGHEPRRNLAAIKLEEFTGGSGTTVHAYRTWKKSVQATARLYKLTDAELALVIYTQVKGKAKTMLDILEIQDLEGKEGLNMVWRILDQAHEKMEHERMDEAYANWEQARRKHGQSMDEWITYLKKVRLEVEAHDGAKVISLREMASKMLRGAGLSTEKRAQVLFNCGGRYDPERVETVLRVTYPKLHETERKQGVVVPRERVLSSHRNGGNFSRGAPGKPRPEVRKVNEVHEVEEDQGTDEAGDPSHLGSEAVGNVEGDPEGTEGSDEGGEDQELGGEGDQDPDGVILEAFLAGWKAKNKTAEARKKRGFVRAPRDTRTEAASEEKGSVDPRKATSRCADCRQLGHWRGDPECSKVKSGEVPKFEKKPPVKKLHVVNWLGMVSKGVASVDIEESDTEETKNTRSHLAQIRLVGPSAAAGPRTMPADEWVRLCDAVPGDDRASENDWDVTVRFSYERCLTHVLDRLRKKVRIHYGTKDWGGHVTGFMRPAPGEKEVTLFVTVVGGHPPASKELMETLMKIIAPIAKEVEQDLKEDIARELEHRDEDVEKVVLEPAKRRAREISSSEEPAPAPKSRRGAGEPRAGEPSGRGADEEPREVRSGVFLHKGQQVRLTGYTSPEMNGQKGRLGVYSEKTGLWQVFMDTATNPDKPKAVPSCCLELDEPEPPVRGSGREKVPPARGSGREPRRSDLMDGDSDRVMVAQSKARPQQGGPAYSRRDVRHPEYQAESAVPRERQRRDRSPLSPLSRRRRKSPGPEPAHSSREVRKHEDEEVMEETEPAEEQEVQAWAGPRRLTLTPEGVPQLIEQWRKRQAFFDEYEIQPLCIHILLKNRVWCLNVTNDEVSEPKVIEKKGAKGVYVTGRSDPGNHSGSGQPPEPPETEGQIGDWTMAEAERDPSGRSERVVAAKHLDKVRREKEELTRRMAELTLAEKDLENRCGDLRPPGSACAAASADVGVASASAPAGDLHAELARRRRAETKGVGKVADDEDAAAGAVWKNLKETFSPPKRGQESSAPAVVETSEGERYETMPKEKAQAGKERLRREMYQSQCDARGSFRAGERTKYDPDRLQEQAACPHRYEDLKWGGNGACVYASCGRCGAKTVVQFARRGDPAFMTTAAAESGGQANELFVVRVPEGTAMLDTGCRAAVGGTRWHRELQATMRTLGRQFRSEPQSEFFQFGPGEPIRSTKKWIYDVGVLGENKKLAISEVPVECPGLVGPDELTQWGVGMEFTDRTYHRGNKKEAMIFTQSGHPCVSLTRFADMPKVSYGTDRAPADWAAAKLRRANQEPAAPEEQSDVSEDDLPDLVPEETDEEQELSDTSESTHAWTSEAETVTDESQDEAEEIFVADCRADTRWMSKGSYRHVRGALKTIEEAMREEAAGGAGEPRAGEPNSCGADKKPRAGEPSGSGADKEPRVSPPPTEGWSSTVRGRKPGPWRVVEIFAWTLFSCLAAGMGWQAFQPVMRPTWDLSDVVCQTDAKKYLIDVDPDVVVVNWTAGARRHGSSTPWQCRRARRELRSLAAERLFSTDVLEWQLGRGRLAWAVGPVRSAVWGAAPSQSMRRPGVDQVVVNRTRVLSTVGLCRKVQERRGLGKEQWDDQELSKAILMEAEVLLKTGLCESYPVGDAGDPLEGLPEERFATADDEVQNEDWSANELPAAVREDMMQRIPRDIRRNIRKAHVGLGHPAQQTFMRMLKLGGASPAALEYARTWQCPVCAESARPGRPQEATSRGRPFGFGKVVCMDLKYLNDAERAHHVALSMVDAGTSWHCASLLKNRKPEHVARKVVEVWIMHYGTPEVFVVDQGGEFEAAFIEMCEEHGIDTRVIGAHAPWQHGFAERHGGILGEVWTKVVKEFNIVGRDKAKLALAVCVQAKNATLTRHGLTPEQAVFGRSLRWFESENRDDGDVLLAALGSDGEAWMAAQIRAAARIALISKDASDKVRQAMMRRAPSVVDELVAGTRVYFWNPSPLKGRYRADPKQWRGPATVIAKEGLGRYYVAWRARVLLVAKEHLRRATTEERAAAETIAKDATLTANRKNYEDLTKTPEVRGPMVIPVPTPADDEDVYERRDYNMKRFVMSQGGGPKAEQVTRREVFDLVTGERIDNRVVCGLPSETLCSRLPQGVRNILTRLYYRRPGRTAALPPEARLPLAVEDAAEHLALEAPASGGDEDQLMLEDGPLEPVVSEQLGVGDELQTPLLALEDEQGTRRKAVQSEVLDDVPAQFKRPRVQEVPVGVTQLPLVAMFAVLKSRGKDEWLDGDCVQGLGRMIGRKVLGARVHTRRRRNLFEHPKHHGNHRLSVMLTEGSGGEANLKDDCPVYGPQGRQTHPSRTTFEWKGLTVFYEAGVPVQTYFLDSPAGLIKVPLKEEDAEDVKEVYQAWSAKPVWEEEQVNDIYALVLKANQKELNPKMFDEEEKASFREADVKEWRQWLLNGSVRVATPAEEHRASKDKVISAPMRYVRTNKAKVGLEAKSRLVIPGHLDPQIGSYRTDAPTTSWLAVLTMVSVGLSMNMSGFIFDVTAAFLSGMSMTREVYVRAPVGGLPAAEGHPAIGPERLLRVLKGAYGLTEAPRLWYLRARALLKECGFEELRCARAVFTLRSAGRLVAILTLHVDDGMLFGVIGDPVFKRARTMIDQKFNIKQWQKLGPELVDYLGVQWCLQNNVMTVHMDSYISKLAEVPVGNKGAEEKLSDEETTQYRRLIAQVRWPVSHVVPQMAYEVSKAAQKAQGEWTVADIVQLNTMVRKLQELAAGGAARLKLRKLAPGPWQVLTSFDASFAREPGMKSQLGFMTFLTTGPVEQEETVCNIAEFQSSTIHRVVKSTLAAEAASMSTALDRQLYLRLLLEAILDGEPACGPDWRHRLKIPGILITDARSLYDHLNKTGSVPKEKQTLIDLLVARDLTEANALKLRWTPTTHMLADILTKVTAMTAVLGKFLMDGLYCLTQTAEEQEHEKHRKELRQGQRQRRRERKAGARRG